jgi:hypothetical protein
LVRPVLTDRRDSLEVGLKANVQKLGSGTGRQAISRESSAPSDQPDKGGDCAPDASIIVALMTYVRYAVTLPTVSVRHAIRRSRRKRNLPEVS